MCWPCPCYDGCIVRNQTGRTICLIVFHEADVFLAHKKALLYLEANQEINCRSKVIGVVVKPGSKNQTVDCSIFNVGARKEITLVHEDDILIGDLSGECVPSALLRAIRISNTNAYNKCVGTVRGVLSRPGSRQEPETLHTATTGENSPIHAVKQPHEAEMVSPVTNMEALPVESPPPSPHPSPPPPGPTVESMSPHPPAIIPAPVAIPPPPPSTPTVTALVTKCDRKSLFRRNTTVINLSGRELILKYVVDRKDKRLKDVGVAAGGAGGKVEVAIGFENLGSADPTELPMPNNHAHRISFHKSVHLWIADTGSDKYLIKSLAVTKSSECKLHSSSSR